MANVNGNNKDLTTKAQAAGAVGPRKDDSIVSLLNSPSMKDQIARALPKHLSADRFARIALTAVRMNPQLAACNKESFLAALLTSSQLGLEPNVLGQSYLIPYGQECQFIIGYQGLLQLIRRSGQVSDIYAEIIYEHDDYEVEFGLERKLYHKPNFELADRGKPKYAYAVAILKDGGKSFVVLPWSEIMKRKAVSKSSKSQYSPWNTWTDEMAKKTAIKALAKYLPLSVEMACQVNTDETVKRELDFDMTMVPDVSANTFSATAETVNEESNSGTSEPDPDNGWTPERVEALLAKSHPLKTIIMVKRLVPADFIPIIAKHDGDLRAIVSEIEAMPQKPPTAKDMRPAVPENKTVSTETSTATGEKAPF